jgi:RNA polymerase sigma-70 factor (ECF subfamily)
MREEEEQQLVLLAQQGDVKAFEAIVLAHQKAIYSFVYNTTHNVMDAEEIAQDVFVKAYRNLSSFRGDARLKTWLFKIAHNTLASHFRKKEVKTSPIDETPLGEANESAIAGAMSAITTEERSRYIEEALGKMAPQQQLLIQLFYLEELSLKEIETVTGLNEGSIKTGLMRGRNRLYALLKESLKQEIHTLL